MIIVNNSLFSWYTEKLDKGILSMFSKYPELMNHYSHEWHVKNQQKRFIFSLIYAPFLFKNAVDIFPPRIRCSYPKALLKKCLESESIRPKVLDVGSGISAASLFLSRRCNYKVVDFLHGSDIPVPNGLNVLQQNWDSLTPSSYDIVIANDLFPNVDQRLGLFLKTFLSQCRLMALSITYYNNPRYYEVKRADADEIFTIQAWDGKQTMSVLKKYKSQICFPRNRIAKQMTMAGKSEDSVFSNGRQVLVLFLRGGRK